MLESWVYEDEETERKLHEECFFSYDSATKPKRDDGKKINSFLGNSVFDFSHHTGAGIISIQ